MVYTAMYDPTGCENQQEIPEYIRMNEKYTDESERTIAAMRHV